MQGGLVGETCCGELLQQRVVLKGVGKKLSPLWHQNKDLKAKAAIVRVQATDAVFRG